MSVHNKYFSNIDKFDEISIYRIHLPRNIPVDMYDELFEKGIIRKSDLKINHYYKGKCRNANVALWNGTQFIYNRYKFGSYFNDKINHLEDDNGYDLFIPLYEIDENDVEEVNKIKI